MSQAAVYSFVPSGGVAAERAGLNGRASGLSGQQLKARKLWFVDRIVCCIA
jgi:hypothetical protein